MDLCQKYIAGLQLHLALATVMWFVLRVHTLARIGNRIEKILNSLQTLQPLVELLSANQLLKSSHHTGWDLR